MRAKRKAGVTRYVIHPVRMGAWVEDYDAGVRLEGLTEASRVVDSIKEFLAAEFPLSKVSHSDFEFSPGINSWSVRVPIRDYVCVASEQVAMIMGLSRVMSLDSRRPVSEDFTAPACVIDAVTISLKDALFSKFAGSEMNWLNLYGASLSLIVSRAIDSALNDAVCAAVDALDGLTPDCNREYILFTLRTRDETGPPDPFSSKSRFRNDLMQALIWWGLPKHDLPQKPPARVTVEDLAYYFSVAGYFDEPDQQTAVQGSEHNEQIGESGGDDRTVRRWIRKYTNPPSNWRTLRVSLIETIRRTGYILS